MGQKCNSNSFRLGINKNWNSRWNSPDKKTTIKWILEDEKVRKFLNNHCQESAISSVEIDRFLNLQDIWTFSVSVYMTNSFLYSENEEEIEILKKNIVKIIGKNIDIKIQLIEIQNPGVSAVLLANEISKDLSNRLPFRSIVKRTIKKAMMSGAKGIKIKISGRINGVEMSRSEMYFEGSIPLSTIRADIDYWFALSKTTYGILGIKVWVNRGLYFGKYFMPQPKAIKNIRFNDKRNHISTAF